jgi:hypothetical protein
MRLFDWFRRRRREREREAEAVDAMRRADEPGQPVPPETYLSQTRD